MNAAFKGDYIMEKYFTSAKNKIQTFLTWQWVKKFLYWIVVSGGTISECVFLIASIWVSVNATVHPLMLKLMSQDATVTLSQLAVSAFTSLPEVILGLAVVTTYGHIKFYCIHKRKSSFTWSILFGVPTVVFASLTIWTLAASALQIGYEMPPFLIATRVLAGYVYGFLSMLYVLIGEPDNADYVASLKVELDKRDATIESLNQEIERLKTSFVDELNDTMHQAKVTLEEKQNEIAQFQNLLKSKNEQVKTLSERASSLVLHELENYPKVINELVSTDAKTVLYSDIARLTGHSKQRIAKAKLQRHSRNKDLVMVSSLLEWLKTAPLPETSNQFETPANGHNHSNTDEIEVFSFPMLSLNNQD